MAGRDDDRHVGIGANIPQQIEAVLVAKPQVEKDQTRGGPCGVAIKFTAVGRGTYWNSIFLEVTGHHASYRFIVVDDNDMARLCQFVGDAVATSGEVRTNRLGSSIQGVSRLLL
jgi:hypothetical protein